MPLSYERLAHSPMEQPAREATGPSASMAMTALPRPGPDGALGNLHRVQARRGVEVGHLRRDRSELRTADDRLPRFDRVQLGDVDPAESGLRAGRLVQARA